MAAEKDMALMIGVGAPKPDVAKPKVDAPSSEPTSARAAAAKALFSAFKAQDWEAAADAVDELISVLDSAADEPLEDEPADEVSPF